MNEKKEKVCSRTDGPCEDNFFNNLDCPSGSRENCPYALSRGRYFFSTDKTIRIYSVRSAYGPIPGSLWLCENKANRELERLKVRYPKIEHRIEELDVIK